MLQFLSQKLAWSLVKRWVRHQFPDVQQLSIKDLVDWLEAENVQPPLLLDTRTQAEYEVSHLPQAHWASEKVHDLGLMELPLTTPIVAYCSVGYRSSAIAQQLQKQGYQTVFNLEGSLFQWVNEGRPVYQGRHLTTAVHPYNRFWGFLLKPEVTQEFCPQESAIR